MTGSSIVCVPTLFSSPRVCLNLFSDFSILWTFPLMWDRTVEVESCNGWTLSSPLAFLYKTLLNWIHRFSFWVCYDYFWWPTVIVKLFKSSITDFCPKTLIYKNTSKTSHLRKTSTIACQTGSPLCRCSLAWARFPHTRTLGPGQNK